MIDDLHTRPKSHELFTKVRAKILEGHHSAGQWLKQADLEEYYGATRSEVRGALSSLAERGIIEYVKNRGFRVFIRSESEINDISEMIVALEQAMAEKIIKNVTPETLKKAKEAAKSFEKLILDGSLSSLRVANYEFHQAVLEICGNKTIVNSINHLRECCSSGPEARYMTYSGLQKSNRGHNRIIQAIEQEDIKELQEVFLRHSTFES